MPLLKSRWKLFAFKHHQISTKPSPRSEFINQKLKGDLLLIPDLSTESLWTLAQLVLILSSWRAKEVSQLKTKAQKKERILNIVCQSLSWLGRVTTKPGKWAKLFHSKLHNIVPSWVSKQYNRSLFKTKRFFSLENELKAALVKLYSVKWQIGIMEYLKSMSASTISMWWPSYQIIRWCQFSEKGIVKKKTFKMKKKQNPHKPLILQQTRSLPYFLPESF